MFVADGPGSRQALAPDIPCCHRCRIRHVELLAGVLKRYLALMAFQLQQRRVNAQSDHTSSLSLPAPLLLAAHPHIA